MENTRPTVENQGSEPRWKVHIVKRDVFTRRPRSKKRRIIRKWMKRPENYTPSMVPIQHILLMGAEAFRSAVAMNHDTMTTDAYFNHADPCRPRILSMTRELWEHVQIVAPDFAQFCDVDEGAPFQLITP